MATRGMHGYLVERAVAWLFDTRKCKTVRAEQHVWAGESPDAIGWYWDGWSVLVECKTTIGDFYSDRRKDRHRSGRYEATMRSGQERWFLTPPGLVRPDQLYGAWGLLEADEGKRMRRVVSASRKRGESPLDPQRMPAEVRLLVR